MSDYEVVHMWLDLFCKKCNSITQVRMPDSIPIHLEFNERGVIRCHECNEPVGQFYNIRERFYEYDLIPSTGNEYYWFDSNNHEIYGLY